MRFVVGASESKCAVHTPVDYGEIFERRPCASADVKMHVHPRHMEQDIRVRASLLVPGAGGKTCKHLPSGMPPIEM